MGLLSSLKKSVVKVLDTNQAIFASPITTLTKGIDAGIAATKAKSQKEIYGDIVKTTVIATGAILTAGTTAGRTAAVAVGKTLAPKTATGAILTAGAGLVAVPALIKSPKAVEKVVETPGALISFGSDLGDVIEGDKGVKELILENPFASALVGLGVAGAVSPLVIPAISAGLTREKIEDVEDAISKMSTTPQIISNSSPIVPTAPPIVSATPAVVPDVAKTAVNNTIPVLPEDKPRTKRKATKRKSAQPMVRITNRNINKLVAVIR